MFLTYMIYDLDSQTVSLKCTCLLKIGLHLHKYRYFSLGYDLTIELFLKFFTNANSARVEA